MLLAGAVNLTGGVLAVGTTCQSLHWKASPGSHREGVRCSLGLLTSLVGSFPRDHLPACSLLQKTSPSSHQEVFPHCQQSLAPSACAES